MRDIGAFYASDMGARVAEEIGRALKASHGFRAAGVSSSPPPNSLQDSRILYLGGCEKLVHGLRVEKNTHERRLIVQDDIEASADLASGRANAELCVAKFGMLPVPDRFFDTIVVVHALEHVESPTQLLREIWRVATDEAKIIFLVPSRRGVWARSDRSPFGHGQPYSKEQLHRLLSECMFAITTSERLLHAPPYAYASGRRTVATMEVLGAAFWPRFAGLLAVEARKRIYAGDPVAEKKPKLASAPAAPL